MLFKIGDFSRITRVSVKALRYYDDLGLLTPAQIDRYTGYRYYTMAQLPRLNRILALKDLGLTLEQIGHVLDAALPAAQIRGMLVLKRAELQQTVEATQAQLARVEARLRMIEQEDTMPDYEVILKQVEAQRVAGVWDVIPNETLISPTISRLFDEVMAHIREHEARIAGPAITLWHGDPHHEQDVQVGTAMPVAGELPDGPRVKVHDLPGATMATVVHRGSFDSLGPAYGAVMSWIAANGYQATGPSRELTLQYTPDGDPATYVTEIQFPVAKA